MSSSKSSKPRVLVLGVNGQDGSYLAEELLSRGHQVIGVGRQSFSRWVPSQENYKYQQLDLSETNRFIDFIKHENPDHIYHLAAIHGPAGFKYEENWLNLNYINIVLTQAILEFLRVNNSSGKLIYASSAKVFSLNNSDIIDENTTRKSDCLYSITKNTSTNLINYYKNNHGVDASTAWLFNHESSRRGGDYFIPIIIDVLKKSIKDSKYKKEIAFLDFYCDWGSAREYMYLMANYSTNSVCKDLIFATGNTVLAREAVKNLFARYGLEYKNHILPRENLGLKDLGLPWKVENKELIKSLGKPQKKIDDIFFEMLEN